MNIRMNLFVMTLVAALAGPMGFLGTDALAAGPQGGRGVRVQPLSADEAATLTFMREEEKMARDVYLNMAARWALPPFANIANSEQQHMDAIKAKLDKYGLPDPAKPEIGAFKNAEIQALYDELMDRGETSYLEALWVGGLIEEVDIEDIDNAIAATSHADLAQVYGNLLRGSRNHLRAFASAIERQGEVYKAQHLDQETVDAIIDSPMERGK
ncbi:MAG: DUF2202 domain-containing protein [Chromatiaceae bacterium]